MVCSSWLPSWGHIWTLPASPASGDFNRVSEFNAFRAGTTIIWAIRRSFVAALTNQVIVTGIHDFGSVPVNTVGAANLIHGFAFLTARRSLRVAWGGGRYRTVISRAKSIADAPQYWRALSTSIVSLIRWRAGIIFLFPKASSSRMSDAPVLSQQRRTELAIVQAPARLSLVPLHTSPPCLG